MESHYLQVLGLKKGASLQEIKKAYRTLALLHHPDKNGGKSEKFKQISEAYNFLSQGRSSTITQADKSEFARTKEAGNYFIEKEYDKAIEIYNEIIKSPKSDRELEIAHHSLGLIYFRLGDTEKSKYHHDKAVEMNPIYQYA